MKFTHHRNTSSRTLRYETRYATFVLALSFCVAVVPSALGQTTSTDPLRTIIPVLFNGTNGDITIGSTTYKGQNPGFHLVALKRQPNTAHLDAPDVVLDKNYNSSAPMIQDLINVQKSSPDAMIMVIAVGQSFRVSEIATKLKEFGGGSDLAGVGSAAFAFIGIGGLGEAAAPLSRGYSTRAVNGFLAPDSNGNYAFLQNDFIRYDINLNGDITVGNNTYTYSNSYQYSGCNGQNAFRLVVVDREDPNVRLANNTYCTGVSDDHSRQLSIDIRNVVNAGEGMLVFIGSMGKPIPANWNFGTDGDARFYPLAQQVRALGGYFETMVYLTPNDTYSLVGASPPPASAKSHIRRGREASSVYPEVRQGQRPTGELHGILARGRGNWYSPLNADASGNANLDFYKILAMPSSSFPRPVGAAEVSAFQYINSKLCTNCNIRDLYDDHNLVFSNYVTVLQSMRDSSDRSCDVSSSNADTNFCNVRAQLLKEFIHVNNIRAFFANLDNLWIASGQLSISNQLSAYNTIKAQLTPPDTTPSENLGLKIANLFLEVASGIPEVGEIFGAADVILNFATELVTDKQGNKTIDLSSTIGNALEQANQQFIAQRATMGTLFQLIYQDWGKLNALGTALASATNQSSPWYWSSTTTSDILTALNPTIQAAAYQTIMAGAYAIGWYVPNSGFSDGFGWGRTPLSRQPHAYSVLVSRSSPSTPKCRPFDIPAYIPFTYPTDLSNEWMNDPRTATLISDGAWLGISALNTPWNSNYDAFQYSPPSPDVLTKLFNPVWKGGLGVYRPAFFNGWPFPRTQCSPGLSSPGYGGSGGCDWSAAAPAPTALMSVQQQVTSLTIRARRLPVQPQRPEVDVELTVHNDGTTDLVSFMIDSIAVRTLGGVGQATLVSPALPIRLNNLERGKSTNVFLRLNVPSGVTRLSLTEQGTHVSTLGPEASRFTESQALVLP